jgi:hypothetical protein
MEGSRADRSSDVFANKFSDPSLSEKCAMASPCHDLALIQLYNAVKDFLPPRA